MAGTFYSQIAANRRNSFLLALVVLLLLGALGFTIGYGLTGLVEGAVGATTVAIVIALLMTAGSYLAGDRMVLAASRARRITEQQAPQLMNVVRELSLAANIPVPAVYVIDDSAPNAFATGRDPGHASIAVTTGLLEKLDREELQGVIAHELGHVANLDIRFTLLVGVLVGSIALLSDFLLRWVRWGGGSGSRSGGGKNSSGGGLQAIMLVVALVLAILAPIAARLVQLAVSRQREYLADATSVSLTRNPYGLERALAKISGDREVLEVANRATQHLYFANPIKKFEQRSSGLFSTHPPIVDRINRLRTLTGQPPIAVSEAAVLEALEDSATPQGGIAPSL
jgi:heat shock protein HtpX